MAKKRYDSYRVKVELYAKTKREALALSEAVKQEFGGYPKIVPQALASCPGDPKTGYTMDHAHARYDGDKWCQYCQAEL